MTNFPKTNSFNETKENSIHAKGFKFFKGFKRF